MAATERAFTVADAIPSGAVVLQLGMVRRVPEKDLAALCFDDTSRRSGGAGNGPGVRRTFGMKRTRPWIVAGVAALTAKPVIGTGLFNSGSASPRLHARRQ